MYPYYLIPCNLNYTFACPYIYIMKVETQLKEDNHKQFRRSKKKNDKIYIPEVIDLLTCFNPAILNSKEFNCIAKLNARKIVKMMLDSTLYCSTEKCKQQKHQLWYYYSLFFNG